LCFILYCTGQTLMVSRRFRLPDFQKIELPDLHTGRLYPQGNISNANFCYRLSRPQSRCVAGSNMSMKNSNYLIWNRTRGLPAYSTMPRTTAPPRAPSLFITKINGSVFTYCLILRLRVFPKLCKLYKGKVHPRTGTEALYRPYGL
jgi:hypothetical protein